MTTAADELRAAIKREREADTMDEFEAALLELAMQGLADLRRAADALESIAGSVEGGL